MSYLDRKPEKVKNSKKVQGVIDAYLDTESSIKCDPFGMYTGHTINPEAMMAINNGYKIYMRIDDNKPVQDADDL